MKPICLLPVAPHYLNSDVDPDSCEYVLAAYHIQPYAAAPHWYYWVHN